MSNLTAAKLNVAYPRGSSMSFIVATGVTLYAGSLVGLTAAGFLDNMADTAGLKFVGVMLETVTGDTTVTPNVEGRVDTSGVTLQNVAIAGTFVIGDLNSPIYATTGNPADCTKTATTNTKAVGWASRFRAAGFGDIQLFTPAEHLGL